MTLRVALEASTVQTPEGIHPAHRRHRLFQFQIGTQNEARRGALVAIPLTDRTLTNSQLVLVSRAGRTLPIATLSFMEALVNRLARCRAEPPDSARVHTKCVQCERNYALEG